MDIYETLEKVQEAERLIFTHSTIKNNIKKVKNKATVCKLTIFSVTYWLFALIYDVFAFFTYCFALENAYNTSEEYIVVGIFLVAVSLPVLIYGLSILILHIHEKKRPYSKKENELLIKNTEQLNYTNTQINELVTKLEKSDIPPRYLYSYAIQWMIKEIEGKRKYCLSDLIELYEWSVPNSDTLYERSALKGKVKINRAKPTEESQTQLDREKRENETQYIKEFNITKVDTADMNMLNSMIGLDSVKTQLLKIRATINYERHYGHKSHSTYHMKFIGNPGTGKTTVAKIMAAILYDLGVITKPKFISVNGNDLMGKYLGQTAPTIDALFEQGKNGLVFIDEAYSLAATASGSDWSGYGLEAVNQLLTHLEAKDNKTVVIFGGYEAPMNKFFDMNPGLRSRVPLTVFFPDYSEKELFEILKLELQKHGHNLSPNVESVVLDLFQQKIKLCKKHDLTFSNGRYVRNVADELHSQHAVNYANDNTIGATITMADIHIDELLNLD